MATICQWTETKSYGDITYRIEKLEEEGRETIEVQARYRDGWAVLERFTKSRLMFSILDKLGCIAAERLTSAPTEEDNE